MAPTTEPLTRFPAALDAAWPGVMAIRLPAPDVLVPATALAAMADGACAIVVTDPSPFAAVLWASAFPLAPLPPMPTPPAPAILAETQAPAAPVEVLAAAASPPVPTF